MFTSTKQRAVAVLSMGAFLFSANSLGAFASDNPPTLEELKAQYAAAQQTYETQVQETNEHNAQVESRYQQEVESCDAEKQRYAQANSEYAKRLEAHNQNVERIRGENAQKKQAYDAAVAQHEQDTARINKENSDAQKAYETKVADWERDSAQTRQENERLKNDYDAKMRDFNDSAQGITEGEVKIVLPANGDTSNAYRYYEQTNVFGYPPANANIQSLDGFIALHPDSRVSSPNISTGTPMTISNAGTLANGKKVDLRITIKTPDSHLTLQNRTPVDRAQSLDFNYLVNSTERAIELQFDFLVDGQPVNIFTGASVLDVDYGQVSHFAFTGNTAKTVTVTPPGTRLEENTTTANGQQYTGLSTTSGAGPANLTHSFFVAGWGSSVRYVHSTTSAEFSLFGPFGDSGRVKAKPVEPTYAPVAPRPVQPTPKALPEAPAAPQYEAEPPAPADDSGNAPTCNPVKGELRPAPSTAEMDRLKELIDNYKAPEQPKSQDPVVIDSPEKPGVVDPCGADNATWVVPENTDSLVWTLSEDGNLSVAPAQANTTFAEGVTTIAFGKAMDSGEQCPVVEEKVVEASSTNPPVVNLPVADIPQSAPVKVVETKKPAPQKPMLAKTGSSLMSATIFGGIAAVCAGMVGAIRRKVARSTASV